MKHIYLDANSHQPMNKKALDAFIDFNNSLGGHGHPSSPSLPGREAADALEKSRSKIAELIGANNANQIIFTNSCTQACEWGLNILFNINNINIKKQLANSIAMSPVEHPAVSESFFKLCKDYKISGDRMPVDENGVPIDSCTYDKIVCIHMQNETGVINPIEDLTCDCIFSDMSQSLGKVAINVDDLKVDIAAFGAHKFGGPSGVGFIYLRDTDMWKEFGTGSRYFLDIVGTPNVAGIVSTAVALEDAIETLPRRTENMFKFQNTLESGLKQLGFEIIAEKARQSPNTTFVKVPKYIQEYGQYEDDSALSLLLSLGDIGVYGVFSGLGSACGSMHTRGNKLMKVLGREDNGLEYMRFSQWGDYSTEEAEYVLTRIQNAMKAK